MRTALLMIALMIFLATYELTASEKVIEHSEYSVEFLKGIIEYHEKTIRKQRVIIDRQLKLIESQKMRILTLQKGKDE